MSQLRAERFYIGDPLSRQHFPLHIQLMVDQTWREKISFTIFWLIPEPIDAPSFHCVSGQEETFCEPSGHFHAASIIFHAEARLPWGRTSRRARGTDWRCRATVSAGRTRPAPRWASRPAGSAGPVCARDPDTPGPSCWSGCTSEYLKWKNCFVHVFAETCPFRRLTDETGVSDMLNTNFFPVTSPQDCAPHPSGQLFLVHLGKQDFLRTTAKLSQENKHKTSRWTQTARTFYSVF